MRLFARCASLAIVALVGIGLAADASAQEIRTYGDDGDSSQSGDDSGDSGQRGGGWVPGMPQPEQSEGDSEGQQTQQQQQQAEGEGEGEGEDEDAATPSHRVRMYGGSSGGAQGGPALPTTLDLTIDQLYRGVIPGTRDEVAHLQSARESESPPNKLTWLGFRPTDEETRIFFQTAREAKYELDEDRDEARIELRIEDTQIASRNFQRFIDTSYFERNIDRVEAREGGDGEVIITIELDSFESPQIETDGNYVYLTFPYEDGSQDSEQVADQDD